MRLANGESVCRISTVNGSLLLEEKVANAMSRMRCSRHSGVILYSYDNGHCMAYTSPPPTAEPLLKEKPFGECICQLSTPAMPDYRAQPRPRGSGQRSWTRGLAKPDRRGNIQGDGWRLRRSGHAEFSLPRGTHAANFSAFQFHQLDFYVTHRFFVTFFTEESNVPPVLLVPSSFPRRS